MEKVYLKDLPNRKDLIGKRINVTRQGGKYKYDYQNTPHLRTFRGAKLQTIEPKYDKNAKPITWIYWFWDAERDWEIAPELEKVCPYGVNDCGESGVTLTENYEGSYLEV